MPTYSYPVTVTETSVDPIPWQDQRTDMQTKARNALAANQTFLDTPNGSITQADALVQLKALTRQVNALIRTMPGLEDLLVENTDT